MKLKKLTNFPDNFLWGAAVSSFQAEENWQKNGQGKSVIENTKTEENTSSCMLFSYS